MKIADMTFLYCYINWNITAWASGEDRGFKGVNIYFLLRHFRNSCHIPIFLGFIGAVLHCYVANCMWLQLLPWTLQIQYKPDQGHSLLNCAA